MEQSEHVLLVGPGATAFALEHGIPNVAPEDLVTAAAREEWEAMAAFPNAVHELFNKDLARGGSSSGEGCSACLQPRSSQTAVVPSLAFFRHMSPNGRGDRETHRVQRTACAHSLHVKEKMGHGDRQGTAPGRRPATGRAPAVETRHPIRAAPIAHKIRLDGWDVQVIRTDFLRTRNCPKHGFPVQS